MYKILCPLSSQEHRFYYYRCYHSSLVSHIEVIYCNKRISKREIIWVLFWKGCPRASCCSARSSHGLQLVPPCLLSKLRVERRRGEPFFTENVLSWTPKNCKSYSFVQRTARARWSRLNDSQFSYLHSSIDNFGPLLQVACRIWELQLPWRHNFLQKKGDLQIETKS